MIKNNSVLGLTSRLAPRPPAKYTVGLSVIEDKLIDGMGSVAYLNQVTVMAKGAPVITGTYFQTADSFDTDGYYDIEGGFAYYQNIYQQS